MNDLTDLVLCDVKKSFGNRMVLDSISLRMEGGHIYGIIGANGCGKTVLMKCICGLMPIDSGRIALSGYPDSEPPKGTFGAVIETPGFLPQFSGYENLKMLSMLSPVAKKGCINKAIDTMGLTDGARMKVGKYSLGMRQRLGIAQAIMDDPPVLLLDEPMNGLDRDSVDHTYELLIRLRNMGKIILVASHHQQDIDRLCDQVYSMENGRLYVTDR
ncbi:MAG: ABC transporter ATP-binding protein [Eubacteriales bacterium]|nr:ABC transporter ATP-binding protein [Eubacteriales bacterium]